MLYGIDIFSGAGGLSLGAEMAGIKISTAIEINPYAAKTFLKNHKGARVLQGDIQELDPQVLNNGKQPPFVIMGGPPCQGFSLSNTRTRNMENKKNFLFLEFVRFVKELRPQWFVLENVGGITNINEGKTQTMIEDCFKAIKGYECISSSILCASDFGVPQNRNRFFMVGNRLGIKFKYPSKHEKKITVDEAINDLPSLQNGDMIDEAVYTLSLDEASDYERLMRKDSDAPKQNYVSRNNDLVIERYKYIGQGQNWRAIPEYLMQNYADKGRCHSGIYKRLRADKPSVVISNYRKSMLIHPWEDRGISVREAARLQSFPDTFTFEGPLMHIQQQIGNAVPPLLAKAVFQEIIKQTKKHEQR
ncbi:DNA cytosine methyltransferase [Prevotella histicola]|jgi:DNA (cytosine-5-)-methyltransferase|uniref:DNA cytosine methyltransferase n=1 Tax=Prevotella histicola TaxID=470565 RepID=UPI00242E3F32|nr:DNA cytosine methyltransferase [Prevotella histicola]